MATNYYESAEKFINEIKKKSNIPGVAVVTVQNEDTDIFTCGKADLRRGIDVRKDTLFELGSLSKAFTILGIFLLKNRGVIYFDDVLSKYIDGFRVVYKGTEYEVTIEQLVYHRTGIPFEVLFDVQEGESEVDLEIFCLALNQIEVNFIPGSDYLYSAGNTDLLAYLIQLITGDTYERFIEENILRPLNLTETYMYRREAKESGKLAKGYKYAFFKPREFNICEYRANKPSGYIISSISDMERWMKINMKMIAVSDEMVNAIDEMHKPNFFNEENEVYVGGGWEVTKSGLIQYRGQNPTYQSMIMMDKENHIGVCVLCNLCSPSAHYLCINVLKARKKNMIEPYQMAPFKKLDMIFSTIDIIMLCINLWGGIGLLCKLLNEGINIDFNIFYFIIWGLCFGLSVKLLAVLPNILADYRNIKWKALKVWSSPSIYYFKHILYIFEFLILGKLCLG